MKIYEKITDGNLHKAGMFFMRLYFSVNKRLYNKFKAYKQQSDELKYLFLINLAEKEMKTDSECLKINKDSLTLLQRKKNKAVEKYINHSLSR